jgi:hypothetical protein
VSSASDFIFAGALFNTITRVEGQGKAVQIVGASPIVRALLLLDWHFADATS